MTELEQAHKELRAAAKTLGQAYGRVGGLTSAAKLSPEQRVARAKKASAAGVASRKAKQETVNESRQD